MFFRASSDGVIRYKGSTGETRFESANLKQCQGCKILKQYLTQVAKLLMIRILLLLFRSSTWCEIHWKGDIYACALPRHCLMAPKWLQWQRSCTVFLIIELDRIRDSGANKARQDGRAEEQTDGLAASHSWRGPSPAFSSAVLPRVACHSLLSIMSSFINLNGEGIKRATPCVHLLRAENFYTLPRC